MFSHSLMCMPHRIPGLWYMALTHISYHIYISILTILYIYILNIYVYVYVLYIIYIYIIYI